MFILPFLFFILIFVVFLYNCFFILPPFSNPQHSVFLFYVFLLLPIFNHNHALLFILCCPCNHCVFPSIYFQIRVVNAFRMGLDTRYDSHSLTSVRSYHSLQSGKMAKQNPPISPLASPDSGQHPENVTNL